jgi:predicted NAD/FAD-binding protein
MSFSVCRNKGELEWSGDNLNTVFAQRSNILPVFHGQPSLFGVWGMVFEILKFHKQAAQIAAEADALQFDEMGRLRDGAGAKGKDLR